MITEQCIVNELESENEQLAAFKEENEALKMRLKRQMRPVSEPVKQRVRRTSRVPSSEIGCCAEKGIKTELLNRSWCGC